MLLKKTGEVAYKVVWRGDARVPPAEIAHCKARTKLQSRWNVAALLKLEGWKVKSVDFETGHIILKGKRNLTHAPILSEIAYRLFGGINPNLVVDDGVKTSLGRLFSINGPPAALTRIGVDNGTTNPTATSTSSDAGGGTDTGSSTQTLRTFDATPTGATSTKVVTAVGTFNDPTTGGIGAVGFIMKRLFLSRHTANITNTTSADAATTLYSMTNVFTIDFTGISTWSLVFSATVTGAGT